MSLTLYLVACSKQKASVTCAAHSLYEGDLFKLSRRYVEQEIEKSRHNRGWYILSAQHGLLNPEVITHPYDTSLLDMGRGPYLGWLFRVQDKLKYYADPSTRFVVLAGKEYRQDLVDWLVFKGATVEVPMQGLGIGQQKAWLKKQTERASV
jgi:hypothetical protein